MTKNDPILEEKFQRLTARKKSSLADYGLTMPEEELRRCTSGRKLLAEIKRAKRGVLVHAEFARVLGKHAAEAQDRMFRDLLPPNRYSTGEE